MKIYKITNLRKVRHVMNPKRQKLIMLKFFKSYLVKYNVVYTICRYYWSTFYYNWKYMPSYHINHIRYNGISHIIEGDILMTKKFCKNCKWYKNRVYFIFTENKPKCTNPQVTYDLVKGNPITCLEARKINYLCGSQAGFFESKEVK